VHPNTSTTSRPEKWHGLVVLGGMTVPLGTAVPMVEAADLSRFLRFVEGAFFIAHFFFSFLLLLGF